MLEKLDLNLKVPKEEFKKAKDGLEIKLSVLQRRLIELNRPVIIVFEGWEASGKGTLINDLILPLDPRGFKVFSTLSPNEEERMRPFLWRFWIKTPARGKIAVFDRSWYRRVLNDRVDGIVMEKDLDRAFNDIKSFERQLSDDGCVILKFFLHISRKEQKKRFEKLQKDHVTAWRVSKDDLKQNSDYGKYEVAIEDMLARTDSEYARWTVIEAHDHRYAALKMYEVVACAFEQAVKTAEEAAASDKKTGETDDGDKTSKALSHSILDKVDLSLTLSRDEYLEQLKDRQETIRVIEHEIYLKRIPVVIVYQGSDAAGKGGNIKRLTARLDPRGYEVVPIAAPSDVEKAHHYLWRFWNQMPKAGHMTVFDRSWYGRLLVERVEGFCSENEWQRAYREINEMEEHMTNFGVVLIKFWLQIDPDEQLRRFKAREETPHKKWKITDEDWRNRGKMDQYKEAVEEMLYRTSTHYAPWTIVESNCKYYARIKVLNEVIKAVKTRLS